MKIRHTLAILACSLLPLGAQGQQGHPLDGIWLGDWGPDASQRNYIVMELFWRDTSLSGTINPGFPDAAAIQTAELDSSDWSVHLEALGKDESGNEVRTVIEGSIDELGSPNRILSGTWQRGEVTGNFTLTRE